jgi:hypothetical protein
MEELSPVPRVPQDEHTGFDFRRNKGWMAILEMVFPIINGG